MSEDPIVCQAEQRVAEHPFKPEALQPSPKPIKTLGLIGVGLIGGSFGLSLKAAGLCERVIGAGRHIEHLEQAKDLGVIDAIVDIQTLAEQADLVFIAVPIKAFDSVFNDLVPHLPDHVLVMDGGSTKTEIIDSARQYFGSKIKQFIPCHPIAGSHESGAAAAKVGLFSDRKLIMTPLPENDASDVTKVMAYWQALGSTVYTMSSQQHDAIFAATSHFPHIMVAAYLNAILDSSTKGLLQMAGSGFRDFTRIGASSAEMWRDIFFSNKVAMLAELQGLNAQLLKVQDFLMNNDEQGMYDWFNRAAQTRLHWELKP